MSWKPGHVIMKSKRNILDTTRKNSPLESSSYIIGLKTNLSDWSMIRIYTLIHIDQSSESYERSYECNIEIIVCRKWLPTKIIFLRGKTYALLYSGPNNIIYLNIPYKGLSSESYERNRECSIEIIACKHEIVVYRAWLPTKNVFLQGKTHALLCSGSNNILYLNILYNVIVNYQ